MKENQNADASKTMTDCQRLEEIADNLAEELCEMQSEKDSLWDYAYKLKQNNADLRRAITSAISYLACMDRISVDEPNEQLAMDVLNEALGDKK